MLGSLWSWFTGSSNGQRRQPPKPRQIVHVQQPRAVSAPQCARVTEELNWLDEATEANENMFGKHAKRGILVGTKVPYLGCTGRAGETGRRMMFFGDFEGVLGKPSCVQLVDERTPWSQDGMIGGHFIWSDASGGLVWVEFGEDEAVSAMVPIDRSQVLFFRGQPMACVYPAPAPVPDWSFNVVFAPHVYFNPKQCTWKNEHGGRSTTWVEVAQKKMHLPQRQQAKKSPTSPVDRRWGKAPMHEEDTMHDLRPAKPAVPERRQAGGPSPSSLDESLARLASRQMQVRQEDVTVDERPAPSTNKVRPPVVPPAPSVKAPPKPPTRGKPRETRTPAGAPRQDVANRSPVKSAAEDWEEIGRRVQEDPARRRVA